MVTGVARWGSLGCEQWDRKHDWGGWCMLGASYHFTLVVLRITGNSSLHRLARVQQLHTPSTAKDALKILGDQEDHAWPGPSWRFWRRILGFQRRFIWKRNRSNPGIAGMSKCFIEIRRAWLSWNRRLHTTIYSIFLSFEPTKQTVYAY